MITNQCLVKLIVSIGIGIYWYIGHRWGVRMFLDKKCRMKRWLAEVVFQIHIFLLWISIFCVWMIASK